MLTQTAAGSAIGQLLRRYWWSIAAADELATNRTKAVRVLGEDCGLRRSYHGWRFDAAGACLEQPSEQASNPNSRCRESIAIAWFTRDRQLQRPAGRVGLTRTAR